MSAENFTRHNKDFVFRFTEQTTKPQFMATMKRAFVEGFTCFTLVLKAKDREFKEGVAFRPEIHTERDVMEFCDDYWPRYLNTVTNVMLGIQGDSESDIILKA